MSRADLGQLAEALQPFDPDIAILEAPDPGPQNALEWALPVLVGIILAGPVKSASDGFFGEMGKDAYAKLKDVLSRLFGDTKDKSPIWKSQNGDVRQAPPLAISFDFDGDSVRFVFPYDLPPAELPAAFEDMNRNIAFLANMVTWQKKQFALLEDHAVDLFGPTYPQQDRWLQNRELLGEIAFGTWVYNATAKSWIKAQ
ncbi:hypothetical protein [Sphingopyxis fribergensis]